MIGITVAVMFHDIFGSLARSRYFSSFLVFHSGLLEWLNPLDDFLF